MVRVSFLYFSHWQHTLHSCEDGQLSLGEQILLDTLKYLVNVFRSQLQNHHHNKKLHSTIGQVIKAFWPNHALSGSSQTIVYPTLAGPMGTQSQRIKASENKPFFLCSHFLPSVLLSFAEASRCVLPQHVGRSRAMKPAQFYEAKYYIPCKSQGGKFYPFLSSFCLDKIMSIKKVLLKWDYFK